MDRDASAPSIAFRPRGQEDLAPPGTAAKLAANLEALEILERLRNGERLTAAAQASLARWSGWGSIPQLFDESNTYAEHRARARRLVGDDGAWAEARRTTLNAHYTSADVIGPVWQAVADLGFTGGRVLEPGCGSGNFIGFAPDGCEITGVEADRTTASIAHWLYGAAATIRAERFESYTAPDGHFDLVIGNVPFAKVTPHDPRYNRGRHALHNYFILKSLHLTRPGGIVAVLTSRYTLDARNPAARREMAQLADLVGAVRLPAGAFRASSGTDVVTDLVILRRRPERQATAGPAWTTATPFPLPGAEDETILLNEYLADHPERILGRLTTGRGMYREHELTVEPTGTLVEQLSSALDHMTREAVRDGVTLVPAERSAQGETRAPRIPVEADLRFAQEGSFVLSGDGVGRVEGGHVRPFEPRVRNDQSELRRLIGLRDGARAVLAAQMDTSSDTDLRDAQRTLTERYETYVRLYGPINRFRPARSGRTDPDTGEEILRRIRPRMGGFRDDPDWPLVAALELFDDATQQARPAAMFTERVISAPTERHGVDTAGEAVAVCLDETGQIEVERVAELLGTDHDTARVELEGHAWEDPVTGTLVPTSQYLAGNVRRKFEAARTAAANDGRWAANVAALEAVLPRQLEPGEITAGLGAPWLPAEDIEAFCREVLGANVLVEHVPTLGRWSVARPAGRRGSVSLTSEWGTARADAITLLDASLNQRFHTVTDESEDGRRMRNDAETIAARDKQDALAARFSTWVWEDPERSRRLTDRYNELFSSVVVPSHDGGHLSLPGLADSFEPHPHQRDAVARILTEGRALLAHAVGAGKTATMVMAAMELRRLGLVRKPAVVVPNHMLDQFTREWLQLYPTAHVLVADKDRLSRDRRKEFVARCATGEWDGIIFTQAGFGRLPLGSDLLARYLSEELDRCREALSVSRTGKALSVKRLERRIAQLEATYERLLATDAKDDGICFEETGVDYLFCDEAHGYKNKRIDSSIDGMSHPGSQRAQDLDAKLWALRNSNGPRVVTFATATPVANSIAELWTMQSYLQPDVLAEVGLAPFDSWAATFGRTVTALELAPDGASYRMQTRFARFSNVPELLGLYRQVADVRTADDLALPVPALAGGAPTVEVVAATDALRDYVAELAERAERVRSAAVTPDEDNMLKITGDGRRAALDLRLVGREPDPGVGKVRAAADRVSAIHAETRDLRYLDDFGEPHPRPGGLQLVFCDASTPSGRGWNAYDELRDRLAECGVPRESIRFIHEASTDEAKAKLFAACRDGRVSVLVGSTEKMGVGTNVQARAVALHHLDCPWRPADIEQREGRLVRQGNQNPEVSVIRYVSEGSFDIYMWQTVERKAAFINQVATGRAVDRDVDDIGDQALSYAEVKALATGNPLILEKASVDADVARLRRLERSHKDDQHRLRRSLDSAEHRAERAATRAKALEAAIPRRRDTRGDRFRMLVDDAPLTKRADAGKRLRTTLLDVIERTDEWRMGAPTSVGELAGFTLTATGDRRLDAEVHLDVGDGVAEVTLTASEVVQSDPVGLVRRLERIANLEDSLAAARSDADEATREAAHARARLGRPFEHADDLVRLTHRQAELNEALTAANQGEPVPPQLESPSARRRPGPSAPGLV